MQLGRLQKLSGAFSVAWAKKALIRLVAVFIALFGLLWLMNMYVDTQVPVSMGGKAVVRQYGKDQVTAEGTWTRSGPSAESAMGIPLQTSQIVCDREMQRCMEAKASVWDHTLISDLTQYEIESWSDTTVVFKSEALCALNVFTIDLKTGTVNGTGHKTNKDDASCKSYDKMFGGGNEESWNYHLADGFPVYWEQHQKARPLLMRLIQTLLGN